jgi:ubiquinone biosynthesis protein
MERPRPVGLGDASPFAHFPANRRAETLSVPHARQSRAGNHMKLSLSHLKRYKEIAFLFWKYGRSDLVQNMGLDEPYDPEKEGKKIGDVTPDQLADDLEAMGPTYIKIGQVLAGRPDLIPPAYMKALERLQDKVTTFPYEEAEQIVMSELGVRISKAFSRFDTTPLATASLGQVHAAALRDGREVVVKIQRPGIRVQIAEDFEVLGEIAGFLDQHTATGRRYRFCAVLEEFRRAIQQELNYETEAQNLITVGANLKEFAHITVPQPVPDYCTRSVLTMDYVQGSKITSISPIARIDIDGGVLVEELFKAYLKQVLVDGIFHADPHPGNVFLTGDHRIALLDLGMVGHTAPGMQENLLKLLLSVSEGKGEDAAETVIRMSEKRRSSTPPSSAGKSATWSPSPAIRTSKPSTSAAPSSMSAPTPATTGCSSRANSPCSAKPCSSSTRSAASSIPPSIPTPPSAATSPT